MSMPRNMQRLTLTRDIRSNKAILGTLFIGDREVAKTLENPWYNNQQDISCIPEGTYKGRKDNTGKFKWWRLEGVPNRHDVEIHEGNRERDTRGCIIIGAIWGFYKGELAVLRSLDTLGRLKDLIEDEFEITIKS
jgi:hypothetical protein